MHVRIELKTELADQPAIRERVVQHRWLSVVSCPTGRAQRSEQAADLRKRRQGSTALIVNSKQKVHGLDDVIRAYVYGVIRGKYTPSVNRGVIAVTQTIKGC